MTCKGICDSYKGTRISSGGRYLQGLSRCNICEIWLMYEGAYCPCCGQKLRKNPRIGQAKLRLRAIKITVKN
jgi:hypothetical protein